MATQLLGIEHGFCSVHFMLCPQGVALQKPSVSGKIGVVAVATCARPGITSGVVVVATYACTHGTPKQVGWDLSHGYLDRLR